MSTTPRSAPPALETPERLSFVRASMQRIGLTRFVLGGFLLALWAVLLFGTQLDFSIVFSDCLVRTGMNGILVLALVPAVRGGVGLNFGIPLGIVCGLLACVALMNADIRGSVHRKFERQNARFRCTEPLDRRRRVRGVPRNRRGWQVGLV